MRMRSRPIDGIIPSTKVGWCSTGVEAVELCTRGRIDDVRERFVGRMRRHKSGFREAANGLTVDFKQRSIDVEVWDQYGIRF